MSTQEVYIALGSNLGDQVKNLKHAIDSLALALGPAKEVSNFYRTKAMTVDGANAPDYVNAAVKFHSSISPDEILKICLSVESSLGRIRDPDVRWGDRTIDIDILFVGSLIIKSPHLEIPHPRFRERDFVLVPLAEIAPELIDPLSNESIRDIRDKLLAANQAHFILSRVTP